MSKNQASLSNVIKSFSKSIALITISFTCYIQAAIAQQVTNIIIDTNNGHVSWMSDGVQWYTVIQIDPYFGGTIPIIRIDLATGNEVIEDEITNCYYRGSLSDSGWQPIEQTHAFINLCHTHLPFTGFVSDSNGVYTIEEDPNSAGQLTMQTDDPSIPLTTSNDTDNLRNGGSSKLLKPKVQVPRTSTPAKFPSVEFMVEPSFVDTFGNPGYLHRIASTLAFANFVYEQNGLNPIHLTSIDLLSGTLNRNGGQGNVRHQLQNLRRSTAQAGSGDVSVLMVGDEIDTAYLWGWAIDKNACELQIAVVEGDKLNSRDIGKSAAFVVDLPSLIQRGWIFAHEFGHVIGAFKHVKGDPLMDTRFQYLVTLPGYIAGCDATTQMYKSCDYDPKTKKVTDFYTCN